MPVTKRTRYEVLKRDNFTCRYCRSTENPLKVDHVTPVALGGKDDPSNLVAACHDCNAGKSSTSPDAETVADISQRAVEWGLAIARYNEIQMADRKKRDAYLRRFDKKWSSWTIGGDVFERPSDWKATAWQFYGLGFPILELEDSVDIACGNRGVHPDNAFRYMCGVVWNKVTKMQDGAKALLESEAVDGP